MIGTLSFYIIDARVRSGQIFAICDRRVVGSNRDGVLAFAIRERGLDLLDQFAGGFGTQFDGDALTPTGSLVDEIDAERMVERGVERMIVIDIGGVDGHPALRSLGAAVTQRRFHDDVGAHWYLLSGCLRGR